MGWKKKTSCKLYRYLRETEQHNNESLIQCNILVVQYKTVMIQSDADCTTLIRCTLKSARCDHYVPCFCTIMHRISRSIGECGRVV